MATAQRTQDVALIRAGTAQVRVRRPTEDHPRTVYGTFRDHGRCHFIVEKDRFEQIEVEYRVFTDNGMLRDLERRANSNKSGTAVRGPATAHRNMPATVDTSGLIGLVTAAANLKSHKALDGPLVARVKLKSQPEPYTPLCRHCGQLPAAHEHQPAAWTNVLDGSTSDAWWCVPQTDAGSCQVCAAQDGVACDYRCPQRETRGGAVL